MTYPLPDYPFDTDEYSILSIGGIDDFAIQTAIAEVKKIGWTEEQVRISTNKSDKGEVTTIWQRKHHDLKGLREANRLHSAGNSQIALAA